MGTPRVWTDKQTETITFPILRMRAVMKCCLHFFQRRSFKKLVKVLPLVGNCGSGPELGRLSFSLPIFTEVGCLWLFCLLEVFTN